MPDDSPISRRGPACPFCGKPATAAHRPFCSTRCRNLDLGRWLRGDYRVETEEGPETDPDAGDRE